MNDLVDNVALAIRGNFTAPICFFLKIDLKNASSQLILSDERSRKGNFSIKIVGGRRTGTYRFRLRFYDLGDMPNEFQTVMDCMVGNLPGTHVCLDDILVATRGVRRTPIAGDQNSFKSADGVFCRGKVEQVYTVCQRNRVVTVSPFE